MTTTCLLTQRSYCISRTTVLKMAVSRFTMASNKKSALMKQQMREISKMLGENPPKEEKARIRAEALISSDGTIEAYEILQLTCELLFERIKLITNSTTCPEDLKSSVATLIWASNRVDIKELSEIRVHLRKKFGQKFDLDAFENKDGICNERIVAKLSFQPPTAYLVQTYLEKIADQFGVDWKPAMKLKPDQMAEPMAAPVGYSVQVAPGSGLVPVNAYATLEDVSVAVSVGAEDASDNVSELGGSVRGNRDNESARGGSVSGASASFPPPVASVSGQSGQSKKSSYDDDIPYAQVIPMAPNDEPDIYIPPAPGTSDGDSKPPADDFDDLQARFNDLKKR